MTTKATENFSIVNNSGADVSDFDSFFLETINNGQPLPEELTDIFSVEVLEAYNPDGSNRGIVTFV